jgi:cell division protein ZapE
MPHEGLKSFRTVREEYDRLLASGNLRPDPIQDMIVGRLDQLLERLAEAAPATKSSALGWLFGRSRKSAERPRGLYLHGGVGRGKTMLMDMFFARVPFSAKRRAHFNDFMADAHDRIQAHRAALKEGRTKEKDPIPVVAADLAREARLLCFDEFTVTDIADAMILSRLFSALFESGVTVVATSNVAPDDLYRDGLNRGLFLPFIETLKAHCDVIAIDGGTDYRTQKLSGLPVYMTPLDQTAIATMDEAWEAATSGHVAQPRDIDVKGRKVRVPLANGTAARFSFGDLCEKPLAARDYLAITDQFDTIFIDAIPVLRRDQRNEAKRFILLVDTLYDRGVKLFATAEAEPDALFADGVGREGFEFARTVSRLTEMRGTEWPPAKTAG